MDAADVRRALVRHWEHEGRDYDVSHEIYALGAIPDNGAISRLRCDLADRGQTTARLGRTDTVHGTRHLSQAPPRDSRIIDRIRAERRR